MTSQRTSVSSHADRPPFLRDFFLLHISLLHLSISHIAILLFGEDLIARNVPVDMHHVDILPDPSRSLLLRREPHREVDLAAGDVGLPTRKHTRSVIKPGPGNKSPVEKKANGKGLT